jgi:hypothetical protein
MNTSPYESFIMSRWHDYSTIWKIVDAIRGASKSNYCFIDSRIGVHI